MPWQTPPNFVPLQTLTDTVMNILADNLDVLFPYTALGQIAVSTAADALGVLDASGNADKAIISNGTTFVFGDVSGGLHKFGIVNVALVGGQTTTSTTGVDITGLTLNLDTTETCTVFVFVVCSVATSGGSIIQFVLVNPFIDGTGYGIANVPSTQVGAFTEHSVNWVRSGVAAGTVPCKAQFAISDASRIANITRATLIALAFKE